MKITAHVLVKNEMRFLWYAVAAVMPFVDKILLWDTGSTDGTLEIIDALKQSDSQSKIHFHKVLANQFNEEQVRQQMLDETTSDWFLVVDGDEIWWNDSLALLVSTIEAKGNDIESIVVPTINVVGDMYHYQEANAGNYRLAGHTGHLAIRAINRKIPGLHSLGRHGIWGWVDENNVQIQDRDSKKIIYLEAPYIHTTYLQRSSTRASDHQVIKRSFKHKYEIGLPIPKDFFYPEAFFKKIPKIVPYVWEKKSDSYTFRAYIETPARKLKRRYWKRKVGY